MLWYQAGFCVAPPADATTSQAPSPSSNLLTVDCRFCPLLAPTVVRYSRSMPWNLSPDRRCQLVMPRMIRRVTAFELTARPPRVPPGVFSKVIVLSLPAWTQSKREGTERSSWLLRAERVGRHSRTRLGHRAQLRQRRDLHLGLGRVLPAREADPVGRADQLVEQRSVAERPAPPARPAIH